MPVPTLKLTYSVKESESSGVFIGRINEIGGIFAQADSPEQVYDDLVRNFHIMRTYKQEEILALLREQQQERFAGVLAEVKPHFNLELRKEYQVLRVA